MDGPRIIVITAGDVDRCPIHSLLPSHYRADGSCECAEEETSS